MESLKFVKTYKTIGALLEKGKGNVHSFSDLQTLFDDELYEKRLRLREIASSAKFQEAVFHQNQNPYCSDAYTSIAAFCRQPPVRDRRNYNDRSKELLVYRYLQRFCTKNETVSFFGPFYVGTCGQTGQNLFLQRRGPEKIARKKVYVANWLLEEIVENVSRGERLGTLRLMPSPCLVVSGGRAVHLASGKRLELDPISGAILGVAEQRKPMSEIISGLGKEGFCKDEIFRKASEMIRGEFVLSGLEVTSKSRRTRENGCERELDGLSKWREAFEKGDLEERRRVIHELTEELTKWGLLLSGPHGKKSGAEKERKSFFTEYCELNLAALRLGKTFSKRLVFYLDFVLNLRLQNEIVFRKLQFSFFHQWLKKNFGKNETRLRDILYRLVEESSEERVPFSCRDRLVDGFPSHFLSFIDRYRGKTRVRFRMKDMERKFDIPPPSGAGPAATCFDLSIGAPDLQAINQNRCDVVFSESHNMRRPLSAHRFFIETSSREKAFARELISVQKKMQKGHILCEFLTLSHDSMSRHYDFPSVSEIEYMAYSERKKNKMHLSDLKVDWRGHQPRLAGKGNKKLLLLGGIPYVGSLFSMFSPKVIPLREEKGHFPRIEIDRFVMQRQQWVFSKRELFFAQDSYRKKGTVLWIELEKWRRQSGLPVYFFLKRDNKKAVFIDFENYFAIETFVYLSKKCRETLWMVEMIPGPEALWLKDDKGRYTSEFRFIVYRS